MPFSDPRWRMVRLIQRASPSGRSLAGGSLRASLELIEGVRRDIQTPIVIFSYANPIVRMGLDAFAARAAAVGVDGVLVLDLPIEEADEFRSVLSRTGVDIDLPCSAPPTTPERVRKAAEPGERLSLRHLAPGRHWRAGHRGERGRGDGEEHPGHHRSSAGARLRHLAARARGGGRRVCRRGGGGQCTWVALIAEASGSPQLIARVEDACGRCVRPASRPGSNT